MLSWYDGNIYWKLRKKNESSYVLYRSDRRKIRKFEKEDKMISILIFIYTIHLAYLKMSTKYHNPKASSCWENWQKCPYVLYRSDRRKIENMKKKAKWAFKLAFIFHLHNVVSLPEGVHKIKKKTCSNRCWEICDRNFIGIIKKWTIKETDKQYVAAFYYTIKLITIKLCTKFENTGSNRRWEICNRNYQRRERKMNK